MFSSFSGEALPLRVDFKDGRRTRLLTEISWDVENLEIFQKYEITIMKMNSVGSIAPRQVHGQTRRMEKIKAHDHTEYA